MVNEQRQLLSRLGIDSSKILIIRLVNEHNEIKTISDIIVELEEHTHTQPDAIIFDYATAYSQRSMCMIALYNEISQLRLNLRWVLTTSDFNYYNTALPNIIYFPYYVASALTSQFYRQDIDIKSYRNFLVGYLTFHLHKDRLIMLIKLLQQSWADRCLYNFLANSPLDQIQRLQLIEAEQWITSIDEINIFTSLKERAPIIADKFDPHQAHGSIQNAAFTNCYVHLFSESGYPLPMVTEKSITPYLTGQLPIILGGDGLTSHMQQLNFEIFDDIFPNFNVNSANEDIRVKLDHIMPLLSNLFDSNIEDIWNQTYERRLHNYNWARSKEFLDLLVSPLRNALT